MKRVLKTLIILGTCAPSILFSQNNNRVSFQTGLFNCFFDGSSLVNSSSTNQAKRIYNYQILSNLLNGKLNDSRGIQYQRKFNSKSSISAEFMFLSTSYEYNPVYNNPEAKPVIFSRNIKTINLTYSRIFKLNEKLDFFLGTGINAVWGNEQIYHYTLLNGWGEPRFYGYKRNDFGINVRTGLDFSPIPKITLFTNLDFCGTLFLNTHDSDGNSANNFYKDKFGINYFPSRFELSWRFGIGYNFGK